MFGPVVERAARRDRRRPLPDDERHPRAQPAGRGACRAAGPAARAGLVRRRLHQHTRRRLSQPARVPRRPGGEGARARRQARARVLRRRPRRDVPALPRRRQAARAAALPVRPRRALRHAGDGGRRSSTSPACSQRTRPGRSIGIGRAQTPMAALAIVMGGHARVGLEDNIYYAQGRAGHEQRAARRARSSGWPVSSAARSRRRPRRGLSSG